MYIDDVSKACFGIGLIYTLGSRLTGVDPIPYIDVGAIICGLICLKKKSSDSMEPLPLAKNGLTQWVQQRVVGIGLWYILKFGALKSILRWNIPNVKYRTRANHHYAEVSIDDGSRQSKIYVPLLRGRYQIRVSGTPASDESITDIPYTTFYSNGYIWSIPVKPEMVGYNKMEFELSDPDNGARRFEVAGSQLADLEDLIGKYQLQIEEANAVSGLAEAYD